MSGLFVTGTDTAVGKTVAACAIVRALRARGSDVGAMKPVETGVTDAGPLDAIALRRAAGDEDDLADVCPQRFALPAAPTVAAAAEGLEVDLDAVRRAYGRLAQRHDLMVLEGAGGLLVPLATGATMADLAGELSLALVIVTRARLGTINHTRLTLEAARFRNLAVAGVVISHADGPLSDADRVNLEVVRADLGDDLIGEIPPLAPGEEPGPDAIDVGALLHALA